MHALRRNYCGLLYRLHTSNIVLPLSPSSTPSDIHQHHHHQHHSFFSSRSAATMLLLHCCRRTIHLSIGARASHYDVLGITPKATQADVKSAYYRLSMIYHPDKSAGTADSVEKFRAITAAYEVLSNYRLRKLYDKGIGSASPFTRTAYGHHSPEEPTVADVDEEEDDAQSRFYKRHMTKTQPPPASGRTPIYNFDEWSAAHYGAGFQRHQAAKNKYHTKQQVIRMEREGFQTEVIVFGMMAMMAALLYISIVVADDKDRDRVRSVVKKKPPSLETKTD